MYVRVIVGVYVRARFFVWTFGEEFVHQFIHMNELKVALICVCVYVYVCMCVCVYVYVCMCMCVCVYVCECEYVSMWVLWVLGVC